MSGSEQRSAERSRTFLRGRIEFNGGQSTFDCLIRDLSETGARLSLSDTASLPNEFRLFVPKNNRWYNAVTRWRRLDSIGVEFAEARPAAAGAESSDRVKELEREVRRLRRLIEELRADPTRIQVLLDQAI